MLATLRQPAFATGYVRFPPVPGFVHPMVMDIRPKTDESERFSDLIEAIAARQDREAFGALFDFYAPRVKAFLMKSGVAAAQADDFAQDALLAVWRKASQFDRSRANASAWIFTIARNLRIDALRRDKRASTLTLDASDGPDDPALPDFELEAAQREQRVRAAMKHLSSDQIRVVELSFFQGKAHGDIAQELKLPLGTVKSRVRLALKRLRELLVDLS